MSKSQELVAILEELAGGQIGVSETAERIKALSPTNFNRIFANLHHYLSDEDIRQKDQRYKDMQVKELNKLIQYLKAGDYSKAETVSFLCESTGL